MCLMMGNPLQSPSPFDLATRACFHPNHIPKTKATTPLTTMTREAITLMPTSAIKINSLVKLIGAYLTGTVKG